MAENDDNESKQDEPKKSGKKGLLVGALLALIAGGGGFYATYSGMILGTDATHANTEEIPMEDMAKLPDVVFVPLQPLVINVGTTGADRFLRFQAQLEVRPEAEQEVTEMLPRIIDVLNGYLRAVEVNELQERAALVKLRAQMLRRIQVVTGQGRVRDLLVMEFVLS